MSDAGFCFKKLYIKEYKALGDLTLEFSGGVNEVLALTEEKAAQIAQFVADLFYSCEPMEGYAELLVGDENVKIGAKGEERCVVPESAADPEKPIGESVTGLSEAVFRELFCLNAVGGEPKKVTPALIDACLGKFGAPEGLFEEIAALDKEIEEYTSADASGTIDKLEARKKELAEKIEKARFTDESKRLLNEEAASYDARLDENAKRSVILKADMKKYTDDIRLIENRANASQLKNEIQANEKKLRIAKYEAEKEIPLPQPAELNDIRRLFSDFSRIKAELSDQTNQLASARENLEFHKKIFDHEDFDAESVLHLYDSIKKNRIWRLALLGLCAVLAVTALVTFIVLAVSPYGSMLYAALVGASVFIASLISFVCSDIFSKKTEIILDGLKIKTKKEFDDLHEKLNAHRKTQVLYEEQITKCEEQCDVFTRLSGDYLEKLRKLLGYTGLSTETSQEVSSICDRLISNCDSLAELEDQIVSQKETYQRLLSANVNKKELVVSSEYSALERELDFVNRQSASLMAKKTALQEKITQLENEAARIPEYEKEISDSDEKIAALTSELEEIRSRQAPLLARAQGVRAGLSEAVCPVADRLLINVRKPDEHFSLTVRMTPVIEGENILSQNSGYLEKMAVLVYRMILSMILLEKCPLFLLDAFSFCDKKTAQETVSRLSASGRQLIVLNFPGSVTVRELLG